MEDDMKNGRQLKIRMKEDIKKCREDHKVKDLRRLIKFKMEDDQKNSRRKKPPKNQNGRRPTKNQNGRRPKKFKMENDQNKLKCRPKKSK